jgi:NAD(P)H-dependent FMN reductase
LFVTAEYDFNYPAPLRNAIEYLFHEWSYKPAGIVSYGGISAGTRAANSLKSDLASVKIVPMFEGVNFSFFAQGIKDGEFIGNEPAEKSLQLMMKELLKWTKALKGMREENA